MQRIVISALTLSFMIVGISALTLSSLGAISPMNPGIMGFHMTPQQVLAAPSVESICTMRNAMLNPMDAKGVLSDLVGTEIAKRSKYIKAYPQIVGAGKWGCAATFYASRHPPSELGNMFGDLIDTTGCNEFTCNILTGPVHIRPLGGLVNAMLMSQMFNNMGGGTPFATGFGQPPLQVNPVQQHPYPPKQPTNQVQTQTPVVQQQSAQPAATSIQPASVQSELVQARPAAQTPPNNNYMMNMFNNPVFQQKLMAFFTRAMANQNTAGGVFPGTGMPGMPGGGMFF